MDESNFRFYGFGQENNSNSLFYNDVFLLMSQKQLNPTISILISIENDNDLIANNFWSDGRIIQLLTNAGAKAIRIKKDSQQNEFQQFNELFSVQAFPSLYVFGPSSAGPSFIYSSTYPDYQQFASDFSTLTYSPTPAFQPPQPQQQQQQSQQEQQQSQQEQQQSQQEQQQSHPQPAQPQPQPPQQKEKSTSQQNSQSNTQQTQNFFNPDEYVHRRPKPQQKQEQKPKKQLPEVLIEVSVTTPDKKTHTDTFKSTDNCLTIRVWVSKLIGKPHTEYKLIVIPGEYILPLSDKVFLRQFAPKLNLRVVLIGANNQVKKNTSQFMKRVSSFLSRLSIFPDPEDDPADFWRKDPVYRHDNKRPS